MVRPATGTFFPNSNDKVDELTKEDIVPSSILVHKNNFEDYIGRLVSSNPLPNISREPVLTARSARITTISSIFSPKREMPRNSARYPARSHYLRTALYAPLLMKYILTSMYRLAATLKVRPYRPFDLNTVATTLASAVTSIGSTAHGSLRRTRPGGFPSTLISCSRKTGSIFAVET
jgi:hypothetical protein